MESGKNYRLLEVGETINSNDEYYDRHNKVWMKTQDAGSTQNENSIARRRFITKDEWTYTKGKLPSDLVQYYENSKPVWVTDIKGTVDWTSSSYVNTENHLAWMPYTPDERPEPYQPPKPKRRTYEAIGGIHGPCNWVERLPGDPDPDAVDELVAAATAMTHSYRYDDDGRLSFEHQRVDRLCKALTKLEASRVIALREAPNKGNNT